MTCPDGAKECEHDADDGVTGGSVQERASEYVTVSTSPRPEIPHDPIAFSSYSLPAHSLADDIWGLDEEEDEEDGQPSSYTPALEHISLIAGIPIRELARLEKENLESLYRIAEEVTQQTGDGQVLPIVTSIFEWAVRNDESIKALDHLARQRGRVRLDAIRATAHFLLADEDSAWPSPYALPDPLRTQIIADYFVRLAKIGSVRDSLSNRIGEKRQVLIEAIASLLAPGSPFQRELARSDKSGEFLRRKVCPRLTKIVEQSAGLVASLLHASNMTTDVSRRLSSLVTGLARIAYRAYPACTVPREIFVRELGEMEAGYAGAADGLGSPEAHEEAARVILAPLVHTSPADFRLDMLNFKLAARIDLPFTASIVNAFLDKVEESRGEKDEEVKELRLWLREMSMARLDLDWNGLSPLLPTSSEGYRLLQPGGTTERAAVRETVREIGRLILFSPDEEVRRRGMDVLQVLLSIELTAPEIRMTAAEVIAEIIAGNIVTPHICTDVNSEAICAADVNDASCDNTPCNISGDVPYDISHLHPRPALTDEERNQFAHRIVELIQDESTLPPIPAIPPEHRARLEAKQKRELIYRQADERFEVFGVIFRSLAQLAHEEGDANAGATLLELAMSFLPTDSFGADVSTAEDVSATGDSQRTFDEEVPVSTILRGRDAIERLAVPWADGLRILLQLQPVSGDEVGSSKSNSSSVTPAPATSAKTLLSFDSVTGFLRYAIVKHEWDFNSHILSGRDDTDRTRHRNFQAWAGLLSDVIQELDESKRRKVWDEFAGALRIPRGQVSFWLKEYRNLPVERRGSVRQALYRAIVTDLINRTKMYTEIVSGLLRADSAAPFLAPEERRAIFRSTLDLDEFFGLGNEEDDREDEDGNDESKWHRAWRDEARQALLAHTRAYSNDKEDKIAEKQLQALSLWILRDAIEAKALTTEEAEAMMEKALSYLPKVIRYDSINTILASLYVHYKDEISAERILDRITEDALPFPHALSHHLHTALDRMLEAALSTASSYRTQQGRETGEQDEGTEALREVQQLVRTLLKMGWDEQGKLSGLGRQKSVKEYAQSLRERLVEITQALDKAIIADTRARYGKGWGMAMADKHGAEGLIPDELRKEVIAFVKDLSPMQRRKAGKRSGANQAIPDADETINRWKEYGVIEVILPEEDADT